MLRPISRLCAPVIICHIPLCLGSPRKGTKKARRRKKEGGKNRKKEGVSFGGWKGKEGGRLDEDRKVQIRSCEFGKRVEGVRTGIWNRPCTERIDL